MKVSRGRCNKFAFMTFWQFVVDRKAVRSATPLGRVKHVNRLLKHPSLGPNVAHAGTEMSTLARQQRDVETVLAHSPRTALVPTDLRVLPRTASLSVTCSVTCCPPSLCGGDLQIVIATHVLCSELRDENINWQSLYC